MSSKSVAVVGVTGAVGQEMLDVLAARDFPLSNLRPLASERSAGRKVQFRGEEIPVEVLGADSFAGVDVALFSAGASISREYGPVAVDAGAVVVDNSSAFRMDPGIPLVVPEVNSAAIASHQGIIANPNCSTIIMVVALQPIHELSPLTRVVVSTTRPPPGPAPREWTLCGASSPVSSSMPVPFPIASPAISFRGSMSYRIMATRRKS